MFVFVLAALVGLSLGLLGAGGSILAVPILRYAAGLSAKQAVATSLATVGAVSFVGAVVAWRQGRLRLKTALVFTVLASLGTLAGARVAQLLNDQAQMLIFVAVLVGAALALARRSRASVSISESPARQKPSFLPALGVGALTGLVGVGGGFLIVPALMTIYTMPISVATGTSLGVIAINSAFGFLTYSQAIPIDHVFALKFAGASVMGLLLGIFSGRKLSEQATSQIFLVAMLFTGAFTIWQELFALR